MESDPAASTDRDRLRILAADLHRKGDLPAARAAYTRYLAEVPDDAGYWSNLGALLRSEGRHDLSLAAQERAFRLKSDSRSILNNLANILTDLGQYDRALPLRERILRQDPGDAQQKAMVGKALRAQGHYAAAIAYLSAAAAAHPAEHELKIQLALSELADRRYASGFQTYEARWMTGELKPRQIARPQWDGGMLEGQTILVLPEQGFGDAIAFARFMPVLRRFNPAKVWYLCEKPLLRLFDGLEGADWIGPDVPADAQFDCWANLMDLARVHFAASAKIPAPTRLAIPEDSRARARAIVAPHRDRFRVGVVWCGSVTYRGNAFRSFSHREFHRLLDLPDLQMFSLYKGPELAAFEADGTASLIVDTASSDRDFADCAATMQEMDLIVTSDTATAHLAGSLGRPCWTLLHWDAFWLWQHQGGNTPWYPSMRLIRQEKPRDWAGVFARVHRKLQAEIAEWKGRRA